MSVPMDFSRCFRCRAKNVDSGQQIEVDTGTHRLSLRLCYRCAGSVDTEAERLEAERLERVRQEAYRALKQQQAKRKVRARERPSSFRLSPEICWQPKEGAAVRIADMNDGHLTNTIKMLERRVDVLREQVIFQLGAYEDSGYCDDDFVAELDEMEPPRLLWEYQYEYPAMLSEADRRGLLPPKARDDYVELGLLPAKTKRYLVGAAASPAPGPEFQATGGGRRWWTTWSAE